MTAELFRALAVIAEPPRPGTEAVGAALELPGQPDAAEYTDLFLLQLWPYASIYVGPEGQLGGEARDRVVGFWRALHLVPPVEPDHLSSLLGLYATLTEREASEDHEARRLLRRRSRHALLWEHLLCWLPPYLAKLDEIGSPFYRAWAAVLRDALIVATADLGRSEPLPLHLREAPALTTTDEILAPVRSGMLLVRDDLKRAACHLGLGLRQGERAYVMKALFDQDPVAMQAWLEGEAKSWVQIHSSMPEQLGIIRDFWIDRAALSAETLRAQVPVPHRSAVGHFDDNR